MMICQSQFGYHMDTWYYCKYLNYKKINYVCFDYGEHRKVIKNVEVAYVSREKSSLLRSFYYLKECVRLIKAEDPELIFIKYFKFCFILKVIFPRRKIVLDIRTADVNRSKVTRLINNAVLRFEVVFFRNITVISESLRKKLALGKSSYILPLGANKLSDSYKSIDCLKLIYVGTLTNRDIDKTIHGLKKYCDKYGMEGISYTIIGSGWRGEEDKLKILAKELGVEEVVDIKGYLHHDDLPSFFEASNIGVSFVPVTDYFDVQPPTKTFEYLLSKLFVIATKTTENINALGEYSDHSILIADTSDGFYQALCQVKDNIAIINKRSECEGVEKHTWPVILTELNKYLKSL